MRSGITVGIPVLGRPGRVAAVARSARESGTYIPIHVLFVANQSDSDEIAELEAQGEDFITVPWEPGPGDFARKHNLAIRKTDEPWYFTGADDLEFHPGWAERALAKHQETGACVIGTNDLGNPHVKGGHHATHLLVHRDYLACGTSDEPGLLFHEGYDHNCVDVEFVETAKWRGTYAHAGDSIVEHLHPLWGKAKRDSTYERGGSGEAADRVLLARRRPLWNG